MPAMPMQCRNHGFQRFPLRCVGQFQKQLGFPIPNFSLMHLANTKAKLFALFEGHSVPADLSHT